MTYSRVDRDRWFLIKTKPHSENIVQNILQQYQISHYLPRLLIKTARSSELKNVPLFPGYIFFQLELNSTYWPFMRWAPGVSYVLTDDHGPVEIPASVIDEIKEREADHRQRKLQRFNRAYEVNEPLRITSGPLVGIDVLFDRPLSAAHRVQVLVQILGKVIPVRVPAASLQRLN